MRIKRACQNLVVIILSMCLVVMGLETGIRLFVPKPYWQFHDFTSDWQLDKVIGWVQKPNLDVTDRTEYGWLVRFQTNKDGLMPFNAQRARTPGKLRIMIFGDSTVVGRSVPYEHIVSTQLQNFLHSENIDAEVINAGVQGYGTDQSLLLMERLIPLYRPDIVIYGFCQNDLGENQAGEAHSQAKPRFKLLTSKEAELILPILKDKIDPGVTGLRKWLQSIALYRFIQPKIFELRVRFGDWNNHKKDVTDELDKFYISPETLNAINWPLFEYLLNRMKTISNANGAQFLFYSHPALQEVWNPYINNIEQNLSLKDSQYERYAIENKLTRIAQTNNILFIPMIDWFLKNRSEGPFHLLPRDPHCNQNGYRLIAEKLVNPCLQLILKHQETSNQ
jgi:hypothetical protein